MPSEMDQVLAMLQRAADGRDQLARELQQHSAQDAERFAAMGEAMREIGIDVKSLLQSRSFTRGVWRAVGVIGGLAGAISALAVSVAKHFLEK